jgi:hypothetical protein
MKEGYRLSYTSEALMDSILAITAKLQSGISSSGIIMNVCREKHQWLHSGLQISFRLTLVLLKCWIYAARQGVVIAKQRGEVDLGNGPDEEPEFIPSFLLVYVGSDKLYDMLVSLFGYATKNLDLVENMWCDLTLVCPFQSQSNAVEVRFVNDTDAASPQSLSRGEKLFLIPFQFHLPTTTKPANPC